MSSLSSRAMLSDERTLYLFDFALCQPPFIDCRGPESYQRLLHYFAQGLSGFKRDNAHKVLTTEQAHSNHLMLVAMIKLENETSLENSN